MSTVGDADVGIASDSTLMTRSSRLGCEPLQAARSIRTGSAAISLGTEMDNEKSRLEGFSSLSASNSALRPEQGSRNKIERVRHSCNTRGPKMKKRPVCTGRLQ